MLAKRESQAGVKYEAGHKKPIDRSNVLPLSIKVKVWRDVLGDELESFVYVSRKGNVYLIVNKDTTCNKKIRKLIINFLTDYERSYIL